jgi:hypothetical protein
MLRSLALSLTLFAELLLLLTAIPGSASAYTDPGSGALIWQALAASFVGMMFYARRLLRFFRREGNVKPQPSNTTAEN